MSDHQQRAERLLHRIDELAAISEDPQGVTRTFGTLAFLKGRDLVQRWMDEAGLQTRIDNIGSLRGRVVSPNPTAKTFVIASHIDTVVNAGKYDGPLGVFMGLDLLEQLIQQKTALPFHLELIAFSDEEGVRFHTTYLGSKVVAGSFDQAVLHKADAAGITVAKALETIGADISKLDQDAIKPEDWLGYFEMHIEQGPVLYERHVPVALVTAIAGQMRVELTFKGMAGHAGTVPMDMRQDALCAAAEFVLLAESFGQENSEELVATVGKLHIPNSASNVIPGDVTCSLDLRSADLEKLESAYQALHDKAHQLAKHRNVTLHWNLIQQTKPANCSSELNTLLTQAISDSSLEVISLVSGAGHDAVPVSAVAPATMLLIRCYKGISHNPLEAVETPDVAAALQVSERFLSLLIKQNQPN
jgi:allantoate deiminase